MRSLLRRLRARFAPTAEADATRREIERLLIDGDPTAAVEAARAASARFGDDPEFPYLVGRAYAALGDKEREAAAYAAAAARDPGFARAERAALKLAADRHRDVMEGWRLYEAGFFAEASAIFAAARARFDAEGGDRRLSAEASRGIGWCALGTGDTAAAAEAFSASIAACDDASARLGLGVARWRLSDLAGAEEALRGALALKPDSADARAFLGWCAYGRADYDRAAAEFSAAAELHPLDADPRFGLAWCAVRKDDVATATTRFAEAAARGALHPSRTDLFALAAVDPRYVAAAESVRVAAESAAAARRDGGDVGTEEAPPPSESAFGADAAEALAALGGGDVERALAATTDALDARLLVLRARAFAESGRADLAAATLKEAVARDPASPYPRLETARTALRFGRASEALAALKPLADRNPDDPDVFQLLADASDALGDPPAAAAARRRAADLLSRPIEDGFVAPP